MDEIIKTYLSNIKDITEQTLEQTKRTALEELLKKFMPDGLKIIHEPPRDRSEKKAGAPDFGIYKNSLAVGYIENKKVNADLDSIKNSEQIKKYLTLSNNILLTDYLRFCLIRTEEKDKAPKIVNEVRLCSLNELSNFDEKFNGFLNAPPLKENIEKLEELLKIFFSHLPKEIIKAEEFANLLALRTRLLKDFILQYPEHQKISHLFTSLKENLYKELSFEEFCDGFAQTLTYSLFLARLNNTESKDLDLYNAKKFIPDYFPLIRAMSGFLENIDNFKEIGWLLEEIINIINHIDIISITKQLNQIAQKDILGDYIHKDPYLHFYETFLKQYDSNLRDFRGVYYTPSAVVDFIINAIDDVLNKEFLKEDGLSEALKRDSNITLLDFATGTGTFLLEAFRKALENVPKNSTEIENISRLIKRFMGFEFLVAPYTIAHLKISQTLKEEFGYEVGKKIKEVNGEEIHERLGIFLTNTLVEFDINNRNKNLGFGEYELVLESRLAQEVKNGEILIITGNPPYNGSSKNKYDKVRAYYDFGIDKNGKPIKEKNPKWLQDDYVKFIRFAEDKIEHQKSGIIAIITNHSFLDNPTFRGMRKHLLNSFDVMYFLDLHGNAKKKEKCPDGSRDENVFDIQQGVCISVFIKIATREKNDESQCQVYHYDLFGDRKYKYNFLRSETLNSIQWKKLTPKDPSYLFVLQNEDLRYEYDKGWSVKDIFKIHGVGICSKRDRIVFHNTKEELKELLKDFATKTKEELHQKYNIGEDTGGWQLEWAIETIKENIDNLEDHIIQCHYRPFDFRWTFYINKNCGFMARPVYDIFEHFLQKEQNQALLLSRQPQAIDSEKYTAAFVSDKPIDLNFYRRGGEQIMPLYIHNTENTKKNRKKQFKNNVNENHLFKDDKNFLDDHFLGKERIENFTPEFRDFIDKKYNEHFSPEVILGYVYAILFHQEYREKYVDFLKNDFPKIPFSDSKEKFLKLSVLGQELIELHINNVSGGGGEQQTYEYWSKCSKTIKITRWLAVCDSNKYTCRSFFDGRGQYGSSIYFPPLFLQYLSYQKNTPKRFEVNALQNIALICNRGSKPQVIDNIFITDKLIDLHLVGSGSNAFPLYLYNTQNVAKVLSKDYNWKK